jgi:Fic family protein
MSDITDADKRAFLAELVALSSVERQQPGDITVTEFQIAANCGYATARKRLAEHVAFGRLTEHTVVLDTGRQGKVFRPTKAAG